MMKKIPKEQLIKYLQINGTTSSSQLAEVFSVSPRTIKSYIKKINDEAVSKLITASKKGYSINRTNYPVVFPKEISREKTLIEKLIYRSSPINKYDLSELLFISTSTLERMIVKTNKELIEFHLKIIIQANLILLTGSEERKRAWIREQFYHETSADFLHLATIQAAFY